MTAKHAVAIPGDHVRISTSAVTEPFWRAAQQRKLVACRCVDCGRFRMPPTPFCPHCQSKHVEWPALAGNGTVYSFAVSTEHFEDFTKGVLDTKHLVYYLSFITFGLYLTARSVDTERWRG